LIIIKEPNILGPGWKNYFITDFPAHHLTHILTRIHKHARNYQWIYFQLLSDGDSDGDELIRVIKKGS
jgi:hypothetical protein